MIIGGFILFGLLMGVRMTPVLEDPMDDSSKNSSLEVSVESDESVESTEATIVWSRSASNLTATMHQLMQLEIFNKTKTNETRTLTTHKVVPSIAHQLQPVAIRPYFYPSSFSPYIFRAAGPYQSTYYHPYLMPVLNPFYPASSNSAPVQHEEETSTAARQDTLFPVDDELSEEEAIKELEAIKKEMTEDAAAIRHQNRLLLPSISINPDHTSVTVSLKSFASLLRSLNSRVTVTLATRTILVPNVSIRN